MWSHEPTTPPAASEQMRVAAHHFALSLSAEAVQPLAAEADRSSSVVEGLDAAEFPLGPAGALDRPSRGAHFGRLTRHPEPNRGAREPETHALAMPEPCHMEEKAGRSCPRELLLVEGKKSGPPLPATTT